MKLSQAAGLQLLLAIDIGNTNIKLGLFCGGSLIKFSIALADSHLFGEGLGELIRQNAAAEKITAAMVSSVVPLLTGQICSALRPYLTGELHIVSHRTNTGLSYSLHHPERLGADRLVAAAWAYHHFGAPSAVIDFGTATTISVTGHSGVFIGGAIIPGLRTMARAFSEHTAALPLVELAMPLSALGKDTREAIISGIVYGTAGAVSRIIYEIEMEIGYNLKIAITGGNMPLIVPCLERVDVAEPDLLLKGLKQIYERMRQAWM
ncbi:type III pantothenate kinase [Candidatus Magnetominusculus xianensis]|uniref:type III pantothenate kinase n=1 Tax=Candidatus Magnetominusculus xianensis TaxID=1748249 RepID=UPI001F00E3B2|nr:type III pantothenate kinase [Candidatus Magnetominusculus xianensis]